MKMEETQENKPAFKILTQVAFAGCGQRVVPDDGMRLAAARLLFRQLPADPELAFGPIGTILGAEIDNRESRLRCRIRRVESRAAFVWGC